MKISCNIIKDLIPLYLDEVCSEESRKLLEEHLDVCPSCKDMLEDMSENEWTYRSTVRMEEEKDKNGFLDPNNIIRRVGKRMWLKTVVTAVVIMGMILYWIFYFLMKHNYLTIPYGVQEIYGIGEFGFLIIMSCLILIRLVKLLKKRQMAGNFILMVALVGFLVLHIGILYYNSNEFHVFGSQALIGKEIRGNRCYVVIEMGEYEVELACTYEIYDNVIVDENVEYTMEFLYNRLNPKKGRLVKLDMDTVIDNRETEAGKGYMIDQMTIYL